MRHYNLSGHQVFKDKLLGKSMGFPDGLDSKESVRNMGDISSIPGLGRSPGERNGNPLQYSCLKNPLGRGAWRATVQSVTKSRTWLSDWECTQWSPMFLAFLSNPVETFCRQLDAHCALASQLWICHLSFSLTASPLGAGKGSELFLFPVHRSPGYWNACWTDTMYEEMEGGIHTE